MMPGTGAATGPDGSYSFEVGKTDQKQMTLVASAVGYESQRRRIREPQGSYEEDFVLRESQELLETVVVTATRTPKPLKDVPIITRVISAEEIVERGIVARLGIRVVSDDGVVFDDLFILDVFHRADGVVQPEADQNERGTAHDRYNGQDHVFLVAENIPDRSLPLEFQPVPKEPRPFEKDALAGLGSFWLHKRGGLTLGCGAAGYDGHRNGERERRFLRFF